jgi:ABC-type branched-chain amino acid transport systems, periplasmic component
MEKFVIRGGGATRLLFALFLLAWPAAARALPYGSGASDPSIVIGVMATLTGPGALAGQDALDGFNLGLKQLGSRFSNQEARVVVVDDKGRPDLARQQVSRLFERERLDMVLTALAPPSLMTVLPRLLERRVFVFNLDQGPQSLSGADCNPALFSLAAPADGVHEALGQYLAAQGMRRIVVVGNDTALTANALAALKRTFSGDVLRVINPRHGAATFKPELDAIAALKPDAVYSLLTGGMGGALVRAWDQSPMKGEIAFFPVWPMVERPLLPAMGEAALGLTGIGTWTPDLDSLPNRRFVTDFESEYGRPATTWAANGYDAVLLLDAALKATGGKTGDTEAVRTALRRAEFVSVRGGFKFNTNHSPVLSYYLRKVALDPRGRPTLEMNAVVLKDWRDHQAPSCPMRWVEEAPPAQPAAKRP